MLALVDCNNFFASCERVFRPDLVNKPVIVLSNNDGCAIARSNEAKKLGIPMGAPVFKFRNIIKKHKVTMFSANFALYSDMSNRVMQLLSQFTPKIEIYSIDEAFLDFSGMDIDPKQYALKIRSQVLKATGLDVSIGIASTKTLAKVANHIAKKFPLETKQVHYLKSKDQIQQTLENFPVAEIWGIGRRLAQRLADMNIYTANQFTKLPDFEVKKQFSVVGLRTKYELLGKAISAINELQSKPKKSISITRTFEKNINDFYQIRQIVANFASNCAHKLRLQKGCCDELTVFIQTNRYQKQHKQLSKSLTVSLPKPSYHSNDIIKAAVNALSICYQSDYLYKRAGVIISVANSIAAKQSYIAFDNHDNFKSQEERKEKLTKAMDGIARKFSKDSVKFAVQTKADFQPKAKLKLSPAYTTDFNQILRVYC